MSERRLRVLIFAQSLHPRGTEKSLVRILKHLDRGSFEPVLVLAAARGPYLEEVPEDMKLVDLRLGRAATAYGILRLAKAVRAIAPDVALGIHTAPGRVLAISTRLSRRVPTVFLEADPFSRNEGRKRFYALRKSLTRRTLRMGDAIVCVSDVVRRDLRDHLGITYDETILLPHACYDDETFALAERPLTDAWMQQPGAPIIVAIGNMFGEKDQATLVEAVARLQRRPRLVIVGEGPLRTELERVAARLGVDLHMPGFQANPYPYLKAATVYVSSSVSEGFDISQVEAMALGLPVVVTAGDRFEAVTHGRSGLVVPPRDPAALSEALARLLDHPDERAAFGANARVDVEPLAAVAVTRRYEELLQTVAEGK